MTYGNEKTRTKNYKSDEENLQKGLRGYYRNLSEAKNIEIKLSYH